MTTETHTHIHTRGCHYFFGALRQLGQGSVVALNGDVRHRLLCLFYLSGRSVRPIDCDASKAGQGRANFAIYIFSILYTMPPVMVVMRLVECRWQTLCLVHRRTINENEQIKKRECSYSRCLFLVCGKNRMTKVKLVFLCTFI